MNQPPPPTAQRRSTIGNTGGVVLAVALAAVGLMAWSWWAGGPDELGDAIESAGARNARVFNVGQEPPTAADLLDQWEDR